MMSVLSDAFRGPAQARAAHRQAVRQAGTLADSIARLQALAPADPAGDSEAPIFLLSAGWRSGSTMLQRLLMSDRRVLIWGEPYDECGLLQAMADSLQAFRPNWPPKEFFHDGTPPHQLTGEWIANLFPSLDAFRSGQRALMDTMFGTPARAAGTPRWGIKEVRLTSAHCAWLRWLYPHARFVLLLRHPLEAYRSYVRYGRSWYDVFPQRPAFTPTVFGRHWRLLAEGYARDAQALGALVVRYEDVVEGKLPLDEIDSYLGISVDRSVLKRKVGSSERGGEMAHVNALERWLLQRAVGPAAAGFGYTNW